MLDIELLALPDGEGWKETQDHSKWAISQTSHWVCVGDINRQHGQLHRGGGTACTLDGGLWKAFSSIIVSVNKTCPL